MSRINSKELTIYPSAFRGINTEANDLVYDPESRLYSERNITRPYNILSTYAIENAKFKGSFVINDEVSSPFEFVIAGYYFKLNTPILTLFPGPSTASTTLSYYAKINLNTETPDTQYNVDLRTTTLKSFDLNTSLDSNNIFTGLEIVTSVSSSDIALLLCEVTTDADNNATRVIPSSSKIMFDTDRIHGGNDKNLGEHLSTNTLTISNIPESHATTYYTVIVDGNGNTLKRNISKSGDATATAEDTSGTGTKTITYVDSVHEDSNGYITETRKTSTISDGTGTVQGAFGFNGTNNVNVGGLSTTNSPTFKNLTLSGESGSNPYISNGTYHFNFPTVNQNKTLAVTADLHSYIPRSVVQAQGDIIYNRTDVSGGPGVYRLPIGTEGQFLRTHKDSNNKLWPEWETFSTPWTDTWAYGGKLATSALVYASSTSSNYLSDITNEVAHFKMGFTYNNTSTEGEYTTNIYSDISNTNINSKWSWNYCVLGTRGYNTYSAMELSRDTSGSTELWVKGTIKSNSTINSVSDRRLKENIKEYSADKSILDLQVYEYDYKDSKQHTIGCMAQDLQEICPEIVHEDDQGYLSIEESKLVYLLLEEVKKLKEEIKELKENN